MSYLSAAFRKRRAKRKLKNVAHSYLKSASEVYWHEMVKPLELRDTALMDECLLTMECASKVAHNDVGGVHVGFFSCNSPMRRALTITCSLVLVFALSTGIAYAAGVNIWQIVANSFNGYFQLSGTSSNDNNGNECVFPYGIKSTNGFVAFESVEAACSNMSIYPLLLPADELNLNEKDVSGAVGDAAITLLADYTESENYLHYMVIMYPNSNTAFSITVSNSEGEHEKISISNMDFYVVNNDNETVVLWCDGLFAYQINTNISLGDLMGALGDLY